MSKIELKKVYIDSRKKEDEVDVLGMHQGYKVYAEVKNNSDKDQLVKLVGTGIKGAESLTVVVPQGVQRVITLDDFWGDSSKRDIVFHVHSNDGVLLSNEVKYPVKWIDETITFDSVSGGYISLVSVDKIGDVTSRTRPENLQVSDKLSKFLHGVEGFVPHWYDATGNSDFTIGYGHKIYTEDTILEKFISKERADRIKNEIRRATEGEDIPIVERTTITKDEANAIYKSRLTSVYVDSSLRPFLIANNIRLTQNEFDALVSITYNFGQYKWNNAPGEKDKFNLGYLIIEYSKGNPAVTEEKIKECFGLYSYAQGERMRGLYWRRMDEANIFIGSNIDYSSHVFRSTKENEELYPLPSNFYTLEVNTWTLE